MDPEVCNSRPLDGLEIVTVKNGWIVHLGGSSSAGMTYRDDCCMRPRYIFQDVVELGLAVQSLLTTGKYERAESPLCEPAFIPPIDGAPGSVSSKDVEQNATREEDKFSVLQRAIVLHKSYGE